MLPLCTDPTYKLKNHSCFDMYIPIGDCENYQALYFWCIEKNSTGENKFFFIYMKIIKQYTNSKPKFRFIFDPYALWGLLLYALLSKVHDETVQSIKKRYIDSQDYFGSNK